jgi:hypothetical protein
MSRVILITGFFDVLDSYGHPTGEKEFLASHGIDEDTGKFVIVSQDHPNNLGAKFDNVIGEFVIENSS